MATYADTPITASGDLKTPGWSDCADIKDTFGCANGLWVNAVYAYKLGDHTNNNPTFLLSINDFEVEKPRLPRG
jgi:hypothetical protein